MSEWIKCSERLPDSGEDVLVYINQVDDGWSSIEVAYYEAAAGFEPYWDQGEWVHEPRFVTHWMPLPTPPEGA